MSADVIFVAKIEPHSRYTREGNNLVMTVNVNLCEALCGAQVPIETLDGRKFNVFNVHMVQPGYAKVLTGEGMPVYGEPGNYSKLNYMPCALINIRVFIKWYVFHYFLISSSGKKGDLIIRFKVKYPNKLTEEQKRHLKSALDPSKQAGKSAYERKPPATFTVLDRCVCPE